MKRYEKVNFNSMKKFLKIKRLPRCSVRNTDSHDTIVQNTFFYLPAETYLTRNMDKGTLVVHVLPFLLLK
jgi:hypothetical protein